MYELIFRMFILLARLEVVVEEAMSFPFSGLTHADYLRVKGEIEGKYKMYFQKILGTHDEILTKIKTRPRRALGDTLGASTILEMLHDCMGDLDGVAVRFHLYMMDQIAEHYKVHA